MVEKKIDYILSNPEFSRETDDFIIFISRYGYFKTYELDENGNEINQQYELNFTLMKMISFIEVRTMTSNERNELATKYYDFFKPYLKQMGCEALAYYLGGSFLWGLDDAESDIDFIIVIKSNWIRTKLCFPISIYDKKLKEPLIVFA